MFDIHKSGIFKLIIATILAKPEQCALLKEGFITKIW